MEIVFGRVSAATGGENVTVGACGCADVRTRFRAVGLSLLHDRSANIGPFCCKYLEYLSPNRSLAIRFSGGAEMLRQL